MKSAAFYVTLIFIFWTLPVYGDAPVVRITIKNQKFVPDLLRLKANVPFDLEVKNEDGIPVEFESLDLNKEKMISPGKSVLFKFKALPSGDYEFFSDFGPKDLRGKIILE